MFRPAPDFTRIQRFATCTVQTQRPRARCVPTRLRCVQLSRLAHFGDLLGMPASTIRATRSQRSHGRASSIALVSGAASSSASLREWILL